MDRLELNWNFEDYIKLHFYSQSKIKKSISIIDPREVKRELEGIVSKVGSG
jgi:hypothetical protein